MCTRSCVSQCGVSVVLLSPLHPLLGPQGEEQTVTNVLTCCHWHPLQGDKSHAEARVEGKVWPWPTRTQETWCLGRRRTLELRPRLFLLWVLLPHPQANLLEDPSPLSMGLCHLSKSWLCKMWTDRCGSMTGRGWAADPCLPLAEGQNGTYSSKEWGRQWRWCHKTVATGSIWGPWIVWGTCG
jgi:hypothetical protein